MAMYSGANSVLGTCATLRLTSPLAAGLAPPPAADGLAAAEAEATVPEATGLAEEDAAAPLADAAADDAALGAGADGGEAFPPHAASNVAPRIVASQPGTRFIQRT